MNDRYLCRAKRTDNGEWVEGNIMTYNDRCFIVPKFGISCIEEHKNLMGDNMISLYAFEVDTSTICYSTGRKDEWEHDIFQCDDERYEIKFHEDSLTWEAVSVFSSESIGLGEFSQSEYVRLGNSIDNTELLEVGE